ncbi:CpaF family protein [Phytohabitans kaempferiae]|uniref:CpaF family protein n=1 Tax=Phytohabitans kaempferiae TaxID=1620943 RepID=A0ABV6M9I8_9ACTN
MTEPVSPGVVVLPQAREVVDELRPAVAAALTRMSSEGRAPADVATAVGHILDAYAERRLAAGHMPLPPPLERQVATALTDAFSGLGPLTSLLTDPQVTNIYLNGLTTWITRADGRKQQVPSPFSSVEALVDHLRDLAARIGVDERRLDRGMPRVSLRLPDGSRLFATLLARQPSVSIRRHTLLDVDLDTLTTRHRAMDPLLRDLLTAMVLARKNILVCGGPAAGKTTMLRALAKAIPHQERIVTIEDTDELALDLDPAHPDCVAIVAREPNLEGHGGVDLAELVRWAMRMSPDRVILGEARGGEVVPLLNCMSLGADGSLATIHTSTSAQAFTKILTYAAQGVERLPFDATAALVGVAVDVVVHLARTPDGTRVISSVREVIGADGPQVTSNEVFRPGQDRRATPAIPLRPATVDEVAAAGFNPDRLAGW